MKNYSMVADDAVKDERYREEKEKGKEAGDDEKGDDEKGSAKRRRECPFARMLTTCDIGTRTVVT